jgi:hypothetical protein
LRRFLMTEPIRPPSLRHKARRGTPSITGGRGGWAHARSVERSVNANRSRSHPAYPVPWDVETAIPADGGHPNRLARGCLRLRRRRLPRDDPRPAVTAARNARQPRSPGRRAPTLRCRTPARPPGSPSSAVPGCWRGSGHSAPGSQRPRSGGADEGCP